MALQIWKYQVEPGINEIKMPRVLDIHHVQYIQYPSEGIFIWVEIDTETIPTIREVNVIGTGWDINKYEKYCGTAVSPSGFVWHVFFPRSAFGYRR